MKFLLEPEADSYQIAWPETVIGVKLDGGAGRYRKDILNASVQVEMTFICDPDEYEYLNSFYRTQTQEGAEPFEMDLIIEYKITEECVCNIIPGSKKLSNQSGLAYTVQLTVEVRPPYHEDLETEDNAIIAAFNASKGYTP